MKFLREKFPVGTRSILFGAHQFIVHPIFVSIAWTKLYGFPRDWRLWVAFFVHDLGYWGKPNMDGPEGESHVELGAKITHQICDEAPRTFQDTTAYHEPDPGYWEEIPPGTKWLPGRKKWFRSTKWHDLCLYHSRFYAKKDGKPFSRLCVADKLVPSIMPKWFYIFQVALSGEIKEYMEAAKTKYLDEVPIPVSASDWYDNMSARMRAWVEEHKDMREDTWTKVRES